MAHIIGIEGTADFGQMIFHGQGGLFRLGSIHFYQCRYFTSDIKRMLGGAQGFFTGTRYQVALAVTLADNTLSVVDQLFGVFEGFYRIAVGIFIFGLLQSVLSGLPVLLQHGVEFQLLQLDQDAGGAFAGSGVIPGFDLADQLAEAFHIVAVIRRQNIAGFDVVEHGFLANQFRQQGFDLLFVFQAGFRQRNDFGGSNDAGVAIALQLQ